MEFSHEIVLPNEGLPFKVFIFEGGEGNYFRNKHWHRSVELFAVYEGEIIFYMNDQAYPLQTGNSCWLILMRFIQLMHKNQIGQLCSKFL